MATATKQANLKASGIGKCITLCDVTDVNILA